jgi:FAD/FMN-containing dehydrogenase
MNIGTGVGVGFNCNSRVINLHSLLILIDRIILDQHGEETTGLVARDLVLTLIIGLDSETQVSAESDAMLENVENLGGDELDNADDAALKKLSNVVEIGESGVDAALEKDLTKRDDTNAELIDAFLDVVRRKVLETLLDEIEALRKVVEHSGLVVDALGQVAGKRDLEAPCHALDKLEHVGRRVVDDVRFEFFLVLTTKIFIALTITNIHGERNGGNCQKKNHSLLLIFVSVRAFLFCTQKQNQSMFEFLFDVNVITIILLGFVMIARIAWLSTRHNDLLPQSNWEGRFAFAAAEFVAPKSPADVHDVIVRARASNRSVKVVGAGHSWSDIAVPRARSTVLMTLNNLSGEANVDLPRKQITFYAGTRLRDAIAIARSHNLAFENLPSVNAQSLAGLLATATHGTGISVGNLATMCTRVHLIDSRGETHTFVRGTDVEFEGVVVHLGAMGVLIEVTFQLVDHFHVHERTVVLPLDTLLDELPQTLAGTKHVKFWPDLASGKAILYRSVPTDAPLRDNPPRWLLDVRAYGFAALQLLTSRLGSANAALAIVVKGWPVLDRVANYDDVFVIPHAIPRHSELEYAFPAEHAASVIRDFRDIVRANKLDIGHILEVRFVKADHIWMSPDYGMDACHITLLAQFRGQALTNRYFALFENYLIKRFGMRARAHWGKTFLNDAHQHTAYPMFDRWNALRLKLGGDMFVNDFIQRVVGVDP